MHARCGIASSRNASRLTPKCVVREERRFGYDMTQIFTRPEGHPALQRENTAARTARTIPRSQARLHAAARPPVDRTVPRGARTFFARLEFHEDIYVTVGAHVIALLLHYASRDFELYDPRTRRSSTFSITIANCSACGSAECGCAAAASLP